MWSHVPRSTPVGPDAVRAAEAARISTGRVRNFDLLARAAKVDLGGVIVDTWAYGDALPGRLLRATAGDRMRIAFRSELPEATSVHWHGLAIRNDMDGVPGVHNTGGGAWRIVRLTTSSSPTRARTGCTRTPAYSWTEASTRQFVIDDPAEPGDYDAEWVVVLDDWTDGIGPNPEQILATLTQGSGSGFGGMGDMGHGGKGDMRGGEVAYPVYLVNGRAPTDPDVLAARPGQRVRLRLINAGADTIFKVAVAGHQLRITHTDGFPVAPADASAS